MTTEIAEAALINKAWPYEEARKLIARYPEGFPATGVLFETGYGPSGLPHIGTFGEVVRTTMVRRAFEEMVPGVTTRLVAFSDDMDGLRKVPDGIPNPELLAAKPRQAADAGARSVRHPRELRRAQQRPAARLPRRLRLRL